jgi:5-methylcytosine-specific restriction endonuclease McrA
LQGQAYRCAYCKELLSPLNFEVDHVIPFSAGGVTSISNSVAACPDCNATKGARHEKASQVAE